MSGRSLVGLGVLLLLLAPGLAGQDLPLHRELPSPADPDPCATAGNGAAEADESERAEASRLSAEAGRALILGDAERARELLERAAALDPGSPEIQFRLGRALEQSGDEGGALEAFCRYEVLAPEGPDGAEAVAAIERLAPEPEDPLPERARAAFEEGLAAFDASRWDAAARAFSRALGEHPELAVARYNRGVAYLRAGRDDDAFADLERYLELAPEARDAERVRDRLRSLSSRSSTPDPGTAFAAGLVVPGLGHFYSGRGGMGALYLVGAGASAAAGLLYTEVDVQCLTVPGPEGCPPGEVLERTETRPFLRPGLVTAAGITVVGAIHAFLDARSSRIRATPSGLQLAVPRAPDAVVSVRADLRSLDPRVQTLLRIPF